MFVPFIITDWDIWLGIQLESNLVIFPDKCKSRNVIKPSSPQAFRIHILEHKDKETNILIFLDIEYV